MSAKGFKRISFAIALLFSCAAFLFADLRAQEDVSSPPDHDDPRLPDPKDGQGLSAKETIKAHRDAENLRVLALEPPDTLRAKKRANVRITPVGAPAYSPELSLWFALGGLFSFKADPENENLHVSAIPLIAGISINKSAFLDSSAALYLADDKIRIYNRVYAGHIKDHYWGVGYDAARNTPKGGLTTAYKRTVWELDTTFLGMITKHLYAGFKTDFNQTKAEDVSAGMAMDPYFSSLGTNILNMGLGMVLQWDSRDFPVNAYRGFYVNSEWMFYASYKGSTVTYGVLDVEYKHYLPLGDTKRILAWMLRTRHGTGTIPWAELSMLGSPFDLRGYYWGRYRDRTMLFGLMEYRHRFGAKTKNSFGKTESRHGVVAWVGTGSVGDGYAKLTEWLPNGGVGYRFELQPRLNARFDFGFGYGSFAFYVKFLDAF